jgi:predicted dehydrogenase
MPNLPIRNHRTSEIRPLRLAMVGMVEENGHPFSWSAIINGRYDGATIRNAGYGMIVDYLAAQPTSALGLPGCELTHVWCDRPEDAAAVAQSAKIENCVRRATDVIGHVDAVIIPTDKGEEHLERARPFVEAGLPVLIDKPLAICPADIDQFRAWHRSGKIVCSTSAMRYAHEFVETRERLADVGEVRVIVATCAKSWERYGIHALEAVYGLLPSGGWLDVCNTGDQRSNIVHVRHAAPADVVIAVNEDMFGGFCHATVYGTMGRLDARFVDRFHAFKTQLQRFIDYVRGDPKAFDMNATIEQCRIIAAGVRSRNLGGRRVAIHAG